LNLFRVSDFEFWILFTMDSLLLQGLQFYGHHGTEAWEKEVGRRFEVDIELFGDLGAAGRTDDMRRAMDYRKIYARAKSVVEGESHNLIERIAWRLVETMMRAYPRVERVRVSVAKPEAPIGGLNRAVVATLDRTREQWRAEIAGEDR
jgi:dihydroneopterin aldolase